jgi:hypothetical protein
VNVVFSSDSAAGASSAPKALQGAGRDQHLEVGRGAAERGDGREADDADEEGRLAAEQVRYACTFGETAKFRWARVEASDPHRRAMVALHQRPDRRGHRRP